MRRMVVLRAGAVVVICAGLALASWQFGRADQKRQLEAKARAGLSAAAVGITSSADALPLFRRARARGVYAPEWTILLDNRLHEGRAGYYVVTPLVLADGTALAVNRGWLAVGKRRNPPPIAPPPPSGEVVVDGYLAADEVDALVLSGQNTDGIVWQRLILDDYAAHIGIALAGRVLVSAKGGDGLAPPPPARVDYRSARSVGYAFQWLSLSVVAVAFYVVLARRERQQREKGKGEKAKDKKGGNDD